MGDVRQDQLSYYGYKSINDMISTECTPLVDLLLKLSSIASNFASAANNVKNIDITEAHQVKELLELTFEARRLSEKVIKIAECRVETHLEVIKSGVFERINIQNLQENAVKEALEVGGAVGLGLGLGKKISE